MSVVEGIEESWLRHKRASERQHLRKARVDPFIVRRFGGWASADTSEGYDEADVDEDLRSAADALYAYTFPTRDEVTTPESAERVDQNPPVHPLPTNAPKAVNQ